MEPEPNNNNNNLAGEMKLNPPQDTKAEDISALLTQLSPLLGKIDAMAGRMVKLEEKFEKSLEHIQLQQSVIVTEVEKMQIAGKGDCNGVHWDSGSDEGRGIRIHPGKEEETPKKFVAAAASTIGSSGLNFPAMRVTDTLKLN